MAAGYQVKPAKCIFLLGVYRQVLLFEKEGGRSEDSSAKTRSTQAQAGKNW